MLAFLSLRETSRYQHKLIENTDFLALRVKQFKVVEYHDEQQIQYIIVTCRNPTGSGTKMIRKVLVLNKDSGNKRNLAPGEPSFILL